MPHIHMHTYKHNTYRRRLICLPTDVTHAHPLSPHPSVMGVESGQVHLCTLHASSMRMALRIFPLLNCAIRDAKAVIMVVFFYYFHVSLATCKLGCKTAITSFECVNNGMAVDWAFHASQGKNAPVRRSFLQILANTRHTCNHQTKQK